MVDAHSMGPIVTRFLFDHANFCLTILKHARPVVGLICKRPFLLQIAVIVGPVVSNNATLPGVRR